MVHDDDSPWKELLNRYLPHVFELLFPRLHAMIDWSVPYQPLDNEL